MHLKWLASNNHETRTTILQYHDGILTHMFFKAIRKHEHQRHNSHLKAEQAPWHAQHQSYNVSKAWAERRSSHRKAEKACFSMHKSHVKANNVCAEGNSSPQSWENMPSASTAAVTNRYIHAPFMGACKRHPIFYKRDTFLQKALWRCEKEIRCPKGTVGASRFEVESHEAARSSDQHVRMNCTIRWHTTHWEKCPNHVHWTQPVLTGAVRTLDDRADKQVASVSMVATSATSAYGTQPVFTGAVQGAAEANGARDTVFVGMKRLSSEADMCPSVSSIKSTRSLDTASAEAVRTLLEVVKQAPHMNLFRMLLLSLPLVGCAHAHGQRFMEMEDSVRRWRAQLLQASEAVEEFGERFLEKVDYMPLNILELAARQFE